MVSIITAVFNQLPMNRLFYQSIVESTIGSWELIIIDNGSTDGSREFFEQKGKNVHVIANDGNYSYPYCQNKGIEAAKGDILAFLNNDIRLSTGWNERLQVILGKDGYDVLSLASNDRMGSAAETRHISRKWKRIKYPMIFLFGRRQWALRAMTYLTYGKWNRFCEHLWNKHGLALELGFSGSAIIMTRRALEILGPWDPTQQTADFDIYCRSCLRHEKAGDIQPLHIVSGIMHHHYRRLTMYCKYPPFKDKDVLIPFEEKWDDATRERYLSALKQR